jgi:predicted anti-sigma-YlaC factor YlaD
MNCQTFIESLPEYRDGMLETAELAAAREHLSGCAKCRQALAREEARAKSLRLGFQRQTESLALAPETRRAILRAAREQATSALGRVSAWEVLWIQLRRPAFGALMLAGMVVFLACGELFFRQHAETGAPARKGEYVCVIDVPLQTEVYAFQQQNNSVVDMLATGKIEARASLH